MLNIKKKTVFLCGFFLLFWGVASFAISNKNIIQTKYNSFEPVIFNNGHYRNNSFSQYFQFGDLPYVDKLTLKLEKNQLSAYLADVYELKINNSYEVLSIGSEFKNDYFSTKLNLTSYFSNTPKDKETYLNYSLILFPKNIISFGFAQKQKKYYFDLSANVDDTQYSLPQVYKTSQNCFSLIYHLAGADIFFETGKSKLVSKKVDPENFNIIEMPINDIGITIKSKNKKDFGWEFYVKNKNYQATSNIFINNIQAAYVRGQLSEYNIGYKLKLNKGKHPYAISYNFNSYNINEGAVTLMHGNNLFENLAFTKQYDISESRLISHIFKINQLKLYGFDLSVEYGAFFTNSQINEFQTILIFPELVKTSPLSLRRFDIVNLTLNYLFPITENIQLQTSFCQLVPVYFEERPEKEETGQGQLIKSNTNYQLKIPTRFVVSLLVSF
ncbi:hypothetical protein ACFL2K_00665 [Candidatus Margulisiibacteriota bacterium]